MSDKILHLSTVRTDPDEDIVAVLEQLIARVRQGEVRHVFIATMDSDGDGGMCSVGCIDVTTVVGFVEVAQQRLIAHGFGSQHAT
jgi:hypothetical protein